MIWHDGNGVDCTKSGKREKKSRCQKGLIQIVFLLVRVMISSYDDLSDATMQGSML